MTEAKTVRQRKVYGPDANTNPHGLWEASSDKYLMHIMNETGGDGRMIRDEVLHPRMLTHLGPMNGKKVFDAGCGDGIVSRAIKQEGAQVIGGDFVYNFAKAAHNSDPPLNTMVSYVESLPIKDEVFDGLVSNLVLMWVPDLDKTIKEFSRVLKSGGRAVISVTHPMINLGEFDNTDDEHPRLILTESQQEGTFLKMINSTNGPYLYYQRPPSTYVNTCTKNGFKLVEGEGLDDVFFTEEFIQRHPQYKRHQMFPLFMILTLEKN